MIRGFDASSVQGVLPYKQLVEQDIRFVILKAQQGNDGFDPYFERNMKAGLDAGLVVFPYCFFYPLPATKASLDPKFQAELFCEKVYRFDDMKGVPIFIDEEWPEVQNWKKWGCTAPQINASMKENAEEVHRISGVRPGLYTYLFWWQAVSAGADTSWAVDYELWMAWYAKGWPGGGSKPKVPKPWSSARFWQFDGNGGLVLPNGVDADFNVFDGTMEELRAFAGQAMKPRNVATGTAKITSVDK